jgi:hypothetical protein
MNIEITGIDHIYIAVADLGRSEKFYDRGLCEDWIRLRTT